MQLWVLIRIVENSFYKQLLSDISFNQLLADLKKPANVSDEDIKCVFFLHKLTLFAYRLKIIKLICPQYIINKN